MRATRVKSILEATTEVAVLLATAAFLSALSWGYFVQKRLPSLEGGLQKGKVLAPLPSIDYSDSEQIFLITMNTKCQPCAEKAPFFNRLAKLLPSANRTTRVVMVFPERQGAVEQFVEQIQFDAEIAIVADIDLADLGVDSTPTIVLLDKGAKVLDFWVGTFPEGVQEQIAQVLTGPA